MSRKVSKFTMAYSPLLKSLSIDFNFCLDFFLVDSIQFIWVRGPYHLVETRQNACKVDRAEASCGIHRKNFFDKFSNLMA